MTDRKTPPERPGDITQDLKYLRFVDPNDKTKIFQLAVIDTGETTPEGVKIYALSMDPSSGGTRGSMILPNTEVGIPTTLYPVTFALHGSELFSHFQTAPAGRVGIPISIAGAGQDRLIFTESSVILYPDDEFTFPLLQIHRSQKYLGILYHSFTDSEPGEIAFEEYHYFIDNGASKKAVITTVIELNSSNQELVIDRECIGSRMDVVLWSDDSNVGTHSVYMALTGKVN